MRRYGPSSPGRPPSLLGRLSSLYARPSLLLARHPFWFPSFPDGSRDSVVGIATGYWLDNRGVGVRAPVGSRILSSRRRPDRLWGPPRLLFNGYGGGISRR
jgi:hypothetical protein